MALRSDRLKKFEAELRDLEQWLVLGLVPKKDIVKHKEEIKGLRLKISEEEERLRFLKESGEMEEYTTRKQTTRTQYTEMPSLPDIDIGEDQPTALAEQGESEGDSLFSAAATDEKTQEEETTREHSEEDDPFSDRNRWRRGMLHTDDEEW